MAERDRARWDRRYAPAGYVMGSGPSPLLIELADLLPAGGRALDLACGEGQTALWLARRGFTVDAVDISPRGLAKARLLAERAGFGDRVATHEIDLDPPSGGRIDLPSGERPYDLITVLRFRPGRLLPRLIEALRPGGALLVEVLTVANLSLPGRARRRAFLAEPGELLRAVSAPLGAPPLAVAWYREGVIGGRGLAQLFGTRSPAAPACFGSLSSPRRG